MFWIIEACKSILVDPKNKIMNIENEHKWSPLNTRLKPLVSRIQFSMCHW